MIDPPDRNGREAILAVHGKGKRFDPDVDLGAIAARTPGFSGADLSNILNEAAILAARRQASAIGSVDVDEAIDRVIAGPQKRSRLMSAEERRTVAIHEAGHAVVGHYVEGNDPVHRVSIVARGRALGWTLALPAEDRYLQTDAELRGRMAMMLGGRAAEEVVLGRVTTGAADDIERVSGIARKMVTEFGMSAHLGPRKFGHNDGEPFLGREMGHQADYSSEVAAKVDEEIATLIDAAHAVAKAVIETHRDVLDALVTALVADETVGDPELSTILDGPHAGRAEPTVDSDGKGPAV
jgi:cell division protease FtsH